MTLFLFRTPQPPDYDKLYWRYRNNPEILNLILWAEHLEIRLKMKKEEEVGRVKKRPEEFDDLDRGGK